MIAKKKKGIDPKPDPKKNKGASVYRDEKGELVARKTARYYDTPEAQAHRKELAKKKGDSSFDGAAAPRVGGQIKMVGASGEVKGGTKSMLKASRRRVKKNAASPAAKRSAIKLYR